MSNEITSTTTSSDQEKFVASELIKRSYLKLVAASVCDKVKQKKGTGKTAYFIRYKRMFVPLSPLSTEGTDPANSTFTVDTATVTLDQWGDIITLTDVSELTTLHPLMQQALELLSDNAQRVIDREIQIVWFTGTNIQYGDASVATRRLITTSMKVSDTIIHRARVTLVDTGVPPRFGPSRSNAQAVQVAGAAGAASINGAAHYLAICGPQVMADVQQAGTSLGTWASAMMYQNKAALYNSEVGTWLGFRWVETNFIPKIKILGNTTAAVVTTAAFGTDTPTVTTATSGGALKDSTTFFYKVTRKDLLRGFEEEISIAHSTATGAAATADDNAIAFNFSSLTAGYVYNLYFDTVAAGGTGTDATMKLVSENIAVGTTVTVTAVPTSGATPPDNVNTTGTPTVHPIYFIGSEMCNWVGLQDLEVMMTKNDSIIGNVLKLKRAIGYKFLAKAMIRDQTRLLRTEVASTY